jgi:hypothetical protein
MKIIIDKPTRMELTSDIASWYVERSFNTSPWIEDEKGNLSYNDEAQEYFNSAYDEVEELLSIYFIEEGE